MKGSPTYCACFKCWISGHLAGPSKMVFPLTWTSLPLDHPLRAAAADLIWRHNTSDPEVPRTGQELSQRGRTCVELRHCKETPDAQPTLVANEASCYYDGRFALTSGLSGRDGLSLVVDKAGAGENLNTICSTMQVVRTLKITCSFMHCSRMKVQLGLQSKDLQGSSLHASLGMSIYVQDSPASSCPCQRPQASSRNQYSSPIW